MADFANDGIFAIYRVAPSVASKNEASATEARDEIYRASLLNSNADATSTSQLAGELCKDLNAGALVPRYSLLKRLQDTSEPASTTGYAAAYVNTFSADEACAGADSAYIVVALFHADYDILESFQNDIDQFCLSIESDILKSVQANDSSDGNVQSLLSGWYRSAVAVILDGIRLLKPVLSAFLYAVLSNENVVIDCSDPALKRCAEHFLELCSLNTGAKADSSTRTVLSKSDNSDSEARPVFLVKVDAATGDVATSTQKANEFTGKWAEVLLKTADAGLAGAARHLILAFKLKVVQDLNMLKRLLVSAENDHYALCRCLHFIRKSQNAELLMVLGNQECSGSSEHVNLLRILSNFL